MEHVVYLDTKAKELDALLSGRKTMIIRGAAGRKIPYGRVNSGDVLFFINNNGDGIVKAKAIVTTVINSEKMSKNDSISFVNKYQDKLQLNEAQFNRWAGKRYIVLVEINNCKGISQFTLDRSKFSNMDDWLLVRNIETVS